MKIALVQHDIVWADREANFARLESHIAEAAAQGARAVFLTEMFSTGFVVDRADIGEHEGGPSSQFLSRLARTHQIWLGGSCPEVQSDDSRPFNSFVLAGPDGSITRYRKIHRFAYGGEDAHFRAGSDHVTVDIDGVRTTLFICYDLRFANEFWDCALDTDLYVIPANWPASRRQHWMALLRARAIENQAYVAGCNRVGIGDNLAYSGDSRIFDPLGEPLAEADDSECIIYADIDPTRVRHTRETFPFLRDRR